MSVPALTPPTTLPIENSVSTRRPRALRRMNNFRVDGEADIFAMTGATIGARQMLRTFLSSTVVGAVASALYMVIVAI